MKRKSYIIFSLIAAIAFCFSTVAYAAGDSPDWISESTGLSGSLWNDGPGEPFNDKGFGFDRMIDMFQNINLDFNYFPDTITKDAIGSALFKFGYSQKYQRYFNIGFLYSLDAD